MGGIVLEEALNLASDRLLGDIYIYVCILEIDDGLGLHRNHIDWQYLLYLLLEISVPKAWLII